MVVVVFATLYVIGVFFDPSVVPLDIKIYRQCDINRPNIQPSILVKLPSEVIDIRPAAPALEAATSDNTTLCPAVKVVTSYGKVSMPEALCTVCRTPNQPHTWGFLSVSGTAPPGSEQSVYEVTDHIDIDSLSWYGDIKKRITFSKWAIDINVASYYVDRTGAPHPDLAIPIFVSLATGTSMTLSMPAATTALHYQPSGREYMRFFGFGNTNPIDPQVNSLYVVYESEQLAAAREYLLVLLAAALGVTLQWSLDTWKRGK